MSRTPSREQTEETVGEAELRFLVQGTAAVTGAEFFRALVRNLAKVLGARCVFVAEFAEVKTRVRTLAFWNGEGFLDTIEYDLAGTPCEAVLRGEIRHYPDRIQTLFPQDHGLAALGAKSYLAVPLMDTAGKVLGHLAVIDDKPRPAAPRDLSIFKIFAARAMAELQRQWAERALRDSEEQLSTILASAMDAVITFDEEHHITLFNPAAEKVFRCAADWAIDQPFDRFLSRQFRNLLKRYLETLHAQKKGSEEQLWAPQGFTALRADGEEFPIEATLSPMQVAGRHYYVVILRDVNERQTAELALRRLQQENRYLQEQVAETYRFGETVGDSPVMREVFAAIEKVARTDTTVLLTGGTGAGKELLARTIHNLSGRKDKLLVTMNCAALPTELIESELFGHEKGAFTGATAQRKGRFELADGGTLFLDEVGELSASAQAKLLRVLQEQEFERVGGTRPIKVNVRVIAATNRDLEKMVKEGAFRADLFYRLNVFPVRVPSLRERSSDIPALVEHFLHKLSRKLGKPLEGVSPQAMKRLLSYPWPGNVRELQNVIERAAILSPGPIINIVDTLGPSPAETTGETPPSGATLEEVERRHIQQVLKSTGWVIEGPKGAAAILGLHPSTLRFRIQKLGIKRPAQPET